MNFNQPMRRAPVSGVYALPHIGAYIQPIAHCIACLYLPAYTPTITIVKIVRLLPI